MNPNDRAVLSRDSPAGPTMEWKTTWLEGFFR